jgi:hypothetical protein
VHRRPLPLMGRHHRPRPALACSRRARDHDVEEIKLFRWKDRLSSPSPVAMCGLDFFLQAARTRRWGFWHHHFVRAGALRAVFGGADPPGIEGVLGPHLSRNRLVRGAQRVALRAGPDRKLFRAGALVPARTLLRLGEPLTGGRLTRNGLEELRRWDCEVPPYGVVDRTITYP